MFSNNNNLKWFFALCWLIIFFQLSGCSKEMDNKAGQTSVEVSIATVPAYAKLTNEDQSINMLAKVGDWLISPAHAQAIIEAYPYVGKVTLTIVGDNGLTTEQINSEYNDDVFVLDTGGAILLSDTNFSLTIPSNSGFTLTITAYTLTGVQFYVGIGRLEAAELASGGSVPLSIAMKVNVDPNVPRLATDAACMDNAIPDQDGDGICGEYEDLFLNSSGQPDVDGDLIINSEDSDSDNDGLLDDSANGATGEGVDISNDGFPAFVHKNTQPVASYASLEFNGFDNGNNMTPTTEDDYGDLHTYEILTQPAHGTVTLLNGDFDYTHEPGFVGTVTFTYRATDKAGLFVDGTGTITINNTAPVLKLLGQPTVEITTGDSYTDAHASASDKEEGDISSSIIVLGIPIDTSIAGEYTIQYQVTDSFGLSAKPVTRLLKIIAVPVAPAITLLGAVEVSIVQGESYIDAGATAAESDGADITSNIVVAGLPIDTATPGSYTITYNVNGINDLPAEPVTRTVIVEPSTGNLTDTDGDGLLNSVETNTGVYVSATDTGTDPLIADTDKDGLLDGVETNTGLYVDATDTGSNPLKIDSDNDRIIDGIEVRYSSNPNSVHDVPQIVSMLGQSDSKGTALSNIQLDSGGINDVSPYGLNAPGYVEADNDGLQLFVTDTDNNRVLVYLLDSVTGEVLGNKAQAVIGQPSFDRANGFFSMLSTPSEGIVYKEQNGKKWFILADTGNNRVLFYDISMGVTSGMNPIKVLGQNAIDYNQYANRGEDTSDCTTSIVDGGDLYSPHSIVVTTMGTQTILFISDSNNDRVLGWNVTASGISGLADGASADYVLGQPNMTKRSKSGSSCSTTTAETLSTPKGLAVIPMWNRLLVSDSSNHRVISYFLGDNAANLIDQPAGMSASIEIGQANMTDNQANRGSFPSSNTLSYPDALHVDLSQTAPVLMIADSYNSRVMEYEWVDGWGNVAVYGKPDTSSGSSPMIPTIDDLYAVTGVTMALGNNRYFADAGYNRVVFEKGMQWSVLGQTDWKPGDLDSAVTVLTNTNTINDVNGVGMHHPEDIAYGMVQGQNYLFVTDSGNSRVTIFEADSNWVPIDLLADAFIGSDSIDNVPPTYTTSATRLDTPIGIAFDSASGMLWVSDRADHRVLGYDLSGGIPAGGDTAASVVLGQPDFVSSSINSLPSATTMKSPNRLIMATISGTRYLFVSDSGNKRLLVYNVSSSITNNQPAEFVLGQADLVSTSSVITASVMNAPKGIVFDETNNYLFVGESLSWNTGRILVWDLSDGLSNGMAASFVLGQKDFTSADNVRSDKVIRTAVDLAYDKSRGELWVSGYNRLLLFDLSKGITNGQGAKMVLGQGNYSNGSMWDLNDSDALRLHEPRGIEFEPNSNSLWFTQYINNRIIQLQTK